MVRKRSRIKRGKSAQAQIITVILIILIVIVGMLIVWNVFRPLIARAAERISLSKLKVDLEIESAYIDDDNQTAFVAVKRGVGKANLTALKFIFTDINNKKYIYKYPLMDYIPDELESKVYNITTKGVKAQNPDLGGSWNFEDIISVGIAFVVRTSYGSEVTSHVKDTFGDSKKEDLRRDVGLKLKVNAQVWDKAIEEDGGKIPDFCDDINSCSDYNQANCTSPDPCGISATGCEWNSGPGVCEEIPAFSQDYVSYWKFDEKIDMGTYNMTPDETGVNNGTFAGNATTIYDSARNYNADITNGYVLSLDGDDYVSVADDVSLQFGTNDFSFSAWIKADIGGSGSQQIINKLYNADRYQFILQNDGDWAIQYLVGCCPQTGFYGIVYAGHDLRDNAWHHIGFTADRDANGTLYLDGVNVKASDMSALEGFNISGRLSALEIGSYEGTGSFFKGLMDDMMIFNRSLSQAEIAQIYNKQKYLCTGLTKCSDYNNPNDCSSNPCNVGNCQWDEVNCLKTAGDTYYVRPFGGNYGLEDGSDYNNAFNGLESIDWNKIDAKDTVYICGLYKGNYYGISSDEFEFDIGANGFDEDSRITIRGDCPGDKGVIWNTGLMLHDTWVNEFGNVWTISAPPLRGYFEDITQNSWTVLTEISNQARITGNWTFTNGDANVFSPINNGNALNELEVGDYIFAPNNRWYNVTAIINSSHIILATPYPGSTYTSDNYAITGEDFSASILEILNTPGSYYNPEDRGGTKLSVHASDSGNPTNRIYANSCGYNLKLNGTNYITLKNLELYAMYRPLSVYDTPAEYATYLRFENVTYWYSGGFYIRDNSHHLEFINCDIAWAGGGIILSDNNASSTDDAPHHITVKGCYIHDISGNPDSEGFGVQGVSHMLIENNEFYNVGSGITFYHWSPQIGVNNTIRWNWIHDTHANCYVIDGRCSRDRGIELNDDINVSNASGNRVYGNIVGPGVDGVGYRSKYEDEVEFYNNICYECGTSFYFLQKHPVRVKMRNLISINPINYHIEFRTGGDESEYMIDSDYNIFYPISGKQFYFAEYMNISDAGYRNFTEWQALSKTGSVFDPNSIAANPRFVSSNPQVPADFKLLLGSPAIDNGTGVGLTRDYEGNIIPQGAGYDIGAYEYIP